MSPLNALQVSNSDSYRTTGPSTRTHTDRAEWQLEIQSSKVEFQVMAMSLFVSRIGRRRVEREDPRGQNAWPQWRLRHFSVWTPVYPSRGRSAGVHVPSE